MNLAATVDLSPDNENYQAIYSSQLYGTFFVVYGKFTTTKDDDNYYLTGAKLRVVNYKGPINVGITQAKMLLMLDNNSNNEGGGIIMEMQGLPENDPATTDVEVTIEGVDGTIPFPKNTSFLWVDRRLKKLHDRRADLSQETKNILENVFDDEFFYREGIYAQGQTPSVGNIPEVWGSDVVIKEAPGTPRCPRAKNKVIGT